MFIKLQLILYIGGTKNVNYAKARSYFRRITTIKFRNE